MAETPTQPKFQGPTNASEAAEGLLRALPRVKNPDNEQYALGYYKGGKPVFTPMSLDRSVAMGTLQGIAEGRVALGDRTLLGSLNVAFVQPLQAAIDAAAKENGAASKGASNPDIVENQKLLNGLLNTIDWAASFGLFLDQPLQVRRGKMNGVGFAAEARKR